MQLPITLSVCRSRTLVIVLLAAHGLAAVGIAPIDFPLGGKLVLWLGLAVSLVGTLARPSATRLTLCSDGRIVLLRADGSSAECQVDQATTVFPWLIVLRVRHALATETLTLPLDALGAEGHRQARVWLRWQAASETV
jgi:hypothetical protein